MKNENQKTARKHPGTPLFWLFLFGMIIPAANEALFGALQQALRFYGGMNAYTAGGTMLFLLGEICEVLYNIVRFTSMTAALMTVCTRAAKAGFLKGLPYGGLYLLFEAARGLLRVGVFALLVALGINDSTLSLAEQLPAGLLTFAVTLGITAVYTLLWLISGGAVYGKTRGEELFAHAGRPIMIASYVMIALYAVLLVIDGAIITGNYESGEDFFTGAVLPVLYPLIYAALMVLTALFYRSAADQTERRETKG